MERSITTTPSTRRWPTKVAPLLAALLLPLLLAAAPACARDYLQLFVMQPYLELHTGPGRGYPVTQVVARGEAVDVLMRRTEWFKVRTEHGIEGWAYEGDLVRTTLADGSAFQINLGDRAGFASHRWESGAFGGAYEGATLISAYQALSLTDHLKIELSGSQFIGNLSNGYLLDIGFSHVFMPNWRLSPFVTLGGGYERVEPKPTLAQPLSSSNETAYVGVGVRCYLARRLFLRGELRGHEVFTNQNSNEVKNEWKLGFAFFY
ncbi:MAG TPA: SH3 domain-containing protein [Steroidobacteraceae bacterium]|nr:SH3 domain-containing protein [Steroidobacteraceae bacterium]